MNIDAFSRELVSATAGCANRSRAFVQALRSATVRDVMELHVPEVVDLSSDLGISRGRIRAIRLDQYGGGLGHKLPVFGGLITYHLLAARWRGSCPSVFLDGGNISTGLALGFFAKRLDMSAVLVMSRYFPSDMREYVERESEGRVRTVVAPETRLPREREFYDYLVNVARKSSPANDVCCLWHAKYGGKVIEPLGTLLAEGLTDAPQDIVLTIGAGATLTGWALPICRRFGQTPRVVAAEHRACPLIELPECDIRSVNYSPHGHQIDWLREPPKGIPHSVLGPHYDELNPLIPKNLLSGIGMVARYGDDQWKQMASKCRSLGMSLGNSSAVNLLVSQWLAEEGRDVLTFIHEPCRPYYVDRRTSLNTGFGDCHELSVALGKAESSVPRDNTEDGRRAMGRQSP